MIELFNEDCMEVMSRYPDNHFDLAIVDPPYGIGMSGGLIGNSKKDYKHFAGLDIDPPGCDYFTELRRISLNRIIWGANHFIDLIGERSACWVVWDKVQPHEFTMAMCELAYTTFTTPAKIFKQRVVLADKLRIHPTQKPVKLYQWLLTNYAAPGQKILDTHLGSGSSAIAAHYYGVDFVGCEIDQDYFNAASERIKLETMQVDMFQLESI